MANKTHVLHNGSWTEVINLNSQTALPEVCVPTRDYIMHLDCGRKYFTPAWIKSLIDELASLGYNALQLHFSEEMGFRIESKLYPWLAGSYISLCVRQLGQTDPDEGKYLTQDEVIDICEYAAEAEIEIIPSFDTFGHCDYIITKYEEYYGIENTIRNYYSPRQSTIQSMGSSYTGPISNKSIDPTNEVARAFLKSLVVEMATLFRKCGCTRWDIGADELLAVGKPLPSGPIRWAELTHWDAYAKKKFHSQSARAMDVYVDWINEINRLLKNMGYEKTYIWNDVYGIESVNGTTVWNKVITLDKDVEFMWWQRNGQYSITLDNAIKAGYKVINCDSSQNYYVLTPNYTQPTVNSYVEHDATNFGNYSRHPYDSAVVGTMFCVWCDNPVGMTETQIMTNIIPLLAKKIQRKEV